MSDPVSFTKTEAPSDDIDRIAIGRVLGFDGFSQIDRHVHQIDRLKEWAVANGAKDKGQITDAVRSLMNRAGSPPAGSNWATHLSPLAHLELERLQIDKQIEKATPHVNEPNTDSPAGEAEISGTKQ